MQVSLESRGGNRSGTRTDRGAEDRAGPGRIGMLTDFAWFETTDGFGKPPKLNHDAQEGLPRSVP